MQWVVISGPSRQRIYTEMDLVVINDSKPRRLAFYLAEEEYLARNFPGRDFFFAWQVTPTVIIGRNQLLEKEVDIDFCRLNNVDVVRRKSGGGAVVADMNNIMFSYITSSDNVCATFSDYTSMVVKALRKLGLDATDNSRNDILIGSRKVSGNSYYHLSGRSIVHGTMLFDYDPELMARTLRPSVAKLASHGVNSTRSRVTTIREHLPGLTLNDFLDHIKKTVSEGNGTFVLDEADIREIERMEYSYYSPEWLTGKNPKGTIRSMDRIDGVGELCVDMTVRRGSVVSFNLSGDYLENGDAEFVIADAIANVRYDRECIAAALDNIDVPSLIPGLTKDKIINLIF